MFSAKEYGEMLMCYGEALGNAAEAVRIYSKRYPNRRQPSPRVIPAAYRRILNNEPIVPSKKEISIRCSLDVEEEILDLFEKNPQLGAPTAARQLKGRGISVSHSTIYKTLKRNNQKLFRMHKHQELLPPNHGSRTRFCKWLLSHPDPTVFVANVFWSDEAMFTRNGMLNAHVWAQENPHKMLKMGQKSSWSVNVWAAMHGHKIYGPLFVPQRLTGDSYLNLLSGPITELAEDVPLALHRTLWFQHDGSPPHTVRPVRNYLDQMFPDRWIGRYGPRAWPPRSPDLTPMHFFVWAYVKENVFDRDFDTEEEMRTRIQDVFADLRKKCAQDGSLYSRVHSEIVARAQVCTQRDEHDEEFAPLLVQRRRNLTFDAIGRGGVR